MACKVILGSGLLLPHTHLFGRRGGIQVVGAIGLAWVVGLGLGPGPLFLWCGWLEGPSSPWQVLLEKQVQGCLAPGEPEELQHFLERCGIKHPPTPTPYPIHLQVCVCYGLVVPQPPGCRVPLCLALAPFDGLSRIPHPVDIP